MTSTKSARDVALEMAEDCIAATERLVGSLGD
jgi:hypothetical protein